LLHVQNRKTGNCLLISAAFARSAHTSPGKSPQVPLPPCPRPRPANAPAPRPPASFSLLGYIRPSGKGEPMAIVALILWMFTAGAGISLLVRSTLGHTRPAGVPPEREQLRAAPVPATAPAHAASSATPATPASPAAAAAPPGPCHSPSQRSLLGHRRDPRIPGNRGNPRIPRRRIPRRRSPGPRRHAPQPRPQPLRPAVPGRVAQRPRDPRCPRPAGVPAPGLRDRRPRVLAGRHAGACPSPGLDRVPPDRPPALPRPRLVPSGPPRGPAGTTA